MSLPREPLHQPPNPDDLRRVPPGSPDCARVRGWMRDFADDDLEPARVREIEEHVHRCRVCSVELARAEHEVMRLRSAFALLPSGPALPAGFAASLVERLVLDETSLVSREALAKAAAAAEVAVAADRSPPGRRGFGLHPVAYVLGAVMLLWGLSLGVEWFDGAAVVPRNSARLVLEDATDCFANNRRLGVGDNVGERQSLRVGRSGRARLSWHDPQPKSQPAALLHVHGEGQVRLEQGAPRIQGHVDVETFRPVSIPMADGSQLDLGVGEYSVSVRPLDDDPLAAIPGELRIEIAVKSGEDAMILREEFGHTLVGPGFVGVYQTSTKVDVVPAGGLGFGSVGGGSTSERVADEPLVPGPQLVGRVRNAFGEPGDGAFVMASFGIAGLQGNATAVCGGDGQFTQALDAPLTTRFVVAQAMAPAWREELGLLAPDAIRVSTNGGAEMLQTPLVFETSVPLVGQLRDADGGGCAGVDVVPCIVDELFGSVLPLVPLRTHSDVHGMFRCIRLPARLPRHQSLVLLLLSDMHAPMAVPIPERGSMLAAVPLPPIELRLLRAVMLHELAANQMVHVIEEIPGLPPGSAIVRRSAQTDGAGVVPSLLVGAGALWLQAGASAAVLHPLFIDQQGVVSRLRPGVTPVAWSEKFQALQVIPATKAEVVHSFRHADFATNPAQHGGVWLQLIDAIGRPAVAQVFALGPVGPGERASVRFLGFSGEDGRLQLPVAPGSLPVVAVAADGSTAFATIDVGATMSPIVLQPTGRVLLGESLRPAGGGVVPLVFERIDTTVPGLKAKAVRFAAASTGWEVGNLAPGLYKVQIAGSAPEVQVPPNGWGNLGN